MAVFNSWLTQIPESQIISSHGLVQITSTWATGVLWADRPVPLHRHRACNEVTWTSLRLPPYNNLVSHKISVSSPVKWDDGVGQGGLECCSPCGHKELDTTERLSIHTHTHTHTHTRYSICVRTQMQISVIHYVLGMGRALEILPPGVWEEGTRVSGSRQP